MTWHIVCLAGPTDDYVPATASGDSTLLVPFDHPDHPDALQNSVADVLAAHALNPGPEADDLMRAAIGAYTGDVRISRRQAYDGWTRDLVLHLPACVPDNWARGAGHLERLLAFLTGDRWRVLVRLAPHGYTAHPGHARQPSPLNTDTVSLFSGGLDSFIGALDALTDVQQVALVGHHAAGQGPTSTAQRDAYAILREAYDAERVPLLQCRVSPPKGSMRASESTTRGRSILFLALGAAVASSIGRARLLVPENGFISLNVPLTPPRLGSLSTRTTHPHLVSLFRDLVEDLKIGVTVELPYRFRTKGEMLTRCADQASLVRGLSATMSCAHPGVSRFVKGGSPNRHCGYCFPCLIRRAAIATHGDDPTPYAWPDLRASLSINRSADVRAVRLATERYGRREPTIADLLAAGPLPGTPEDRSSYLATFRRGIHELRQFLENAA